MVHYMGRANDAETTEAATRPPILRRGAKLSDARDVWRHTTELRTEMREHFVMFTLNVRHRVIAKHTIAIGSLCGVEVHPREVFRQAIIDAAAAIIIVHNHPSGEATPSRQDVELTQRLRDVGELIGIPVLDHVVVADVEYASLAERGWK